MSRYNWMVAGVLMIFLTVAGYLFMTARSDMVQIDKEQARSEQLNKQMMAEKERVEALAKKEAPKNIMDRVGDKVVTELVPGKTLQVSDRMTEYRNGMDLDKFLGLGTTQVLVFGSDACAGCEEIEASMRSEMRDLTKTVYLFVDGSKYEKMLESYGVEKMPTLVVTGTSSTSKKSRELYRRELTEITRDDVVGLTSEMVEAVKTAGKGSESKELKESKESKESKD